VAPLTRRENFIENFSTALGLSGVIEFISGLMVIMTWLHFSVPLGLNADVSSSCDVELYDPSCNINHGFGSTQEWAPKNERYLTTDIHFKYHEVQTYKRIPDSHRDIFRDSHWTLDRLIR
jgi:hypothetical protein